MGLLTKDGWFEEIAFFVAVWRVATKDELEEFKSLLSAIVVAQFVCKDVIKKAPSSDMMVTLARSVLTLYSYDKNANDIFIPNVLRQCLQLIATFPLLAVYGFQAYEYYLTDKTSFFIHEPRPELSTAENILHMLRIDSKYTRLEAMYTRFGACAACRARRRQ